MELGALICTPRSPQCDNCPVNKLCVARTKDLQAHLPNLGKREIATARRFVAFIVERNGKFLVRQRPERVVNAQLWEFPNVEVPGAPSPRQRVSKAKPEQPASEPPALPGCDFRLTSAKSLCTIQHTITRYRITLEAYRAELTDSCKKPNGRWLSLAQLHQLAFPSAHKKILANLGTRGTASARTEVHC